MNPASDSHDGRDEHERSAFRDALRLSVQTVPGLFAWGAVTGMAMVQTGLYLWQSLPPRRAG